MPTKKKSPFKTVTIKDAHIGVPFRSTKVSIEGATLHVIQGPHKGESLQLDREILHIGRAEWCDLILRDDLRASGYHCELRMGPEGVKVRDLESRNGVLIDGTRIHEAYIRPGQHLQLGETTLLLESDNHRTQIEIPYFDASGQLVGKSEKMRKIFAMLKRLQDTTAPILLCGETGTGKSSVARILHESGQRNERPFVTVNCGSLSPSLIESSLFGYEKGAFTGAAKQTKGYFEHADGGTLFFDEIGELPLSLQPKLLDVLERRCIQRLGGTQDIPVDFRLITATHRSLAQEVQEGRFREDLYYRISVVELEIPPLRDRREDIPLLVSDTLRKLAPQQYTQLTPEAIQHMQQYLWPGNVRQLQNVLERTLLLTKQPRIDVEALQLPSQQKDDGPHMLEFPEQIHPLKPYLEDIERNYLVHALDAHDWNVQQTATTLEITQGWLYNRMRKYKLKRPAD